MPETKIHEFDRDRADKHTRALATDDVSRQGKADRPDAPRTGTSERVNSETPRATNLADAMSGLSQSVDGVLARIDQLLDENAHLQQLVREAYELLSNQPTDLSLRDWRKAAEAALVTGGAA